MKIAGFLVVGRGEADRYLPRVLKRIESLCDKIFIWGNDPDKKTDELCSKYEYTRYPKDEWGKKQWLLKESHIIKNIKPYNPDWVVCVDADEILDERFTRSVAEEMAERGEIAYKFYCIQLWDREDQMRIDGGWGNFWNVRYYKFVPGAGLNFERRPLHCGLAPLYAYRWAANSGFLFKHYGYLKEEDRIKKWERYQNYDPEMKYFTPNWYRSILGNNPELREFNEKRFGEKLKYVPIRPLKHKYLKGKIMEKTFYIKNRYGKVFAVKESMLDEHLKRPGMRLLYQGTTLEKEIEKTLEETEVITKKTIKKVAKGLPKPNGKKK